MGMFQSFLNQSVRTSGASSGKHQTPPFADIPDATAQARKVATFNSVTSCVMLADQNLVIVECNDAALAMLRRVEDEIRSVIPAFAVDTLIGSSIDLFHRQPERQRYMLAGLTAPHIAEIPIGNLRFELITSPITGPEGARLGVVVEWKDITERVRREAAEQARAVLEQKQNDENSRIRSALDAVVSNVMVADADGVIVYMNPAVKRMLVTAEADLRKGLPQFDAERVLGNTFDIFHKNPAHQRGMVQRLTSTFRTTITVGGRRFSLIASPVWAANNTRLGTVVEWQDQHDEQVLESIIEEAVQNAVHGDLSSRIEVEGKTGLLRSFALSFNELLGAFNRVLEDVNSSLMALSQGDLRRTITADYEGSYDDIKRNINDTFGNLTRVFGEIQASATSVDQSASEISEASMNLSQRTEEQAASLVETSAALVHITSMVDQNSNNTQQARELSHTASSSATTGGGVADKAIASMQMISASSKKIADITSVIDAIAFQTNLLALNAAVEAARAGDMGRGFAVVADEVRNLASRSAVAAREIKELIQDSLDKVKEGEVLVNHSGEALKDIVSAVDKVRTIVNEISVASREQAQSLSETTLTMSQLDDMTQQNTALVEETSAASESLASQAQKLLQLISYFRI